MKYAKFIVGAIIIAAATADVHSENNRFDNHNNIINVDQYAKMVFKNRPDDLKIAKISVSFVNSPFNEDKSAMTSFADAYLWATGVRTVLSDGYAGDMSIIYIKDFDVKENFKFKDKLLEDIYESQFSTIKDGGSCTKLIATNSETKTRRYFVFLDSKSNFDDRATCIYRHFRSMFGLNEKFQLSTFGRTFVTDLRLLNCKYSSKENLDVVELLNSGKC